MNKLGFIGAGNMATAMMSGIIRSGIFTHDEIIMSDVSEAQRRKVGEAYGVSVTDDNVEVAHNAEVLILAVKPQYYSEVIAQIRDVISQQLIITIAPGQTLASAMTRLRLSARCPTHRLWWELVSPPSPPTPMSRRMS